VAPARGATRSELRLARLEAPSPLGHRLRVWAAIIVVVALVVALGAWVHARMAAPPPTSVVHVDLSSVRTVSGPPAQPAIAASLPWTPTGQSAVAIPALGYAAQSGPEQSMPVASLTKLMTGYLILRDHPIAPGTSGPNITMTAVDAGYFADDTVSDQANVEVQPGEVLTEKQLLEGMLIHSANNLALTLGSWDAGSVPAFVAKMNAMAAQLGMTQTRYADPSGFDPGSMSTPADLLKVASVDMSFPVFAQIVQMSSVTLPLAGLISSYTPGLVGEVGTLPNAVGVKSGFTTAAGGCDVLALKATVGTTPVIVLGAVTNQQGPNVLQSAGQLAYNIAAAAATHIVTMPLPPAGQHVGSVSVLGHSAPAVTAATGSMLAWPGDSVHTTMVVTNHPRAGTAAAAAIGDITYGLGTQRVTALVRTSVPLPPPSLFQRLF